MSVELEEKHTEASVLALLRKRHAAKNGNGPEWADVEKVRDAPGFDAMRTADAMALGLWKSRGHELHGFEVKVSRSDWRRELADPAKAEGWCEIVDRWWIVAPRGVVPRDELPATGGLLETGARGLTVTVQAALLRDERLPLQRKQLVPLLRAAGAGLTFTPNEAVRKAAYDEGYEAGRQRADMDWHRYEYEMETANASKLQREASDLVTEVEEILGVELRSWRSPRERCPAA